MAGKSIAPLLLLGGAAVIVMSGKKTGGSGRTTGPAFPDGVPLPPPISTGGGGAPVGEPAPDPESEEVYLPIQMAYLGYSLKGGRKTIEDFQADYNIVMMLQTAGKAKTFGMLLDEDGVIGPRTKDAIITAIDIQNEHGSWPDFVRQAAVQYGEA